MRIGYDGKRAYQNKTGLGNYARSLLTILAQQFPQHRFTLFAPKRGDLFEESHFGNMEAILPNSHFGKKFPSWWRRFSMSKRIAEQPLDIFHGISNELPRHIERSGVKSVITVHDIIFERHPETYNFDERYVHRWKIRHGCKVADAVIAISEQTKADLMHFYKVPENKIAVCYQSCNPIFQQKVDAKQLSIVKKRYQLPDRYFLFVSSIAPRKNLIAICKAMLLLKGQLAIPLVVIGNGKKEKEAVKKFMQLHGLSQQLILLNELPMANEMAFTSAADFPSIYQQALALIYPSIFEGFGLPLLEALWSGLPIISSNTSSLPEVAGEAALYFAPHDPAALAQHMLALANDQALCENLRSKGFEQAQLFTPEKYANSVMKVYQQLL